MPGSRRAAVAAEAGVNHGLVHYYFGSMEELLLQVLERFTDRLIERQTAMYEADVPFLEKWRTAMRWLEEDVEAGYPKVWWELQAMAWNHPEMQERLVQVDEDLAQPAADRTSRAPSTSTGSTSRSRRRCRS